MLTNSFGYATLDWSSELGMFNIGLKKVVKRVKRVGQEEQMASQVKKVLGSKDQGLIVMFKS